MANLYSQNYQIDFAGTGASILVDSVKVENLTQGTSLTLNGIDTLQLTLTTGVHNLDFENEILEVYPNPLTDQTELTFITKESGNVLVAIYDQSGRTVIQSGKLLQPGKHKYFVSGIKQGTYIVRIVGHNFQYSAKLISLNSNSGMEKIYYAAFENLQTMQPEKKQFKNTCSRTSMPYNNGDRLKFTGISDIYSTILVDIPTKDTTFTFNFIPCTDYDNHNYPTVQIGSQVWMAENLKTMHYTDGTSLIDGDDPSTGWLSDFTKYFVTYNSDVIYVKTYGLLYTWTAAMNGLASSNSIPSGVQGVCPSGWHLPSNGEWQLVISYLGGEGVAGEKMKTTGTIETYDGLWHIPNTDATNQSGFSALPGGYRSYFYNDLGFRAAFWTSNTDIINSFPVSYWLYWGSNEVLPSNCCNESHAFSVRCIKD